MLAFRAPPSFQWDPHPRDGEYSFHFPAMFHSVLTS
jgi:hypothetical protein